MVLEIKIILPIALIIKFSFLLSQEKRILLLNEKDSTFINNIELYQRGFIENRFISNEEGIVIFKPNHNSLNNLIINNYRFEYKELLINSLRNTDTIYLKEDEPLNYINEVTFYGGIKQKDIRKEVKTLLKNHTDKCSKITMKYNVNGNHEVLENSSNVFIALHHPFEIYFGDYNKIEKTRGIHSFITEDKIYKKKTSMLLIPYYSSIFMNTVFSKINLYDIKKNINKYTFIKYEQNGNIFYEFEPENIKSSFLYEGFIEVSKNNDILKTEFKLVDYKGNTDNVVSISKKIPGSVTEYELEKTTIEFDKKGNPLQLYFKSLLSQRKDNLNIQYNVESDFSFSKINDVKKGQSILKYLYIEPKKIKKHLD